MSILSARSNRPPANTVNPHPRKFSRVRSLPAGLALTPFRERRLLPADRSARATRQHRRTAPCLRKTPECASARSAAPYRPQAQTLPGRLVCGGPVAAAETADVHPQLKIPTTKLTGRDVRGHRPSVPDMASSIESRTNQSRPGAATDSRLPRTTGIPPRSDRHLRCAESGGRSDGQSGTLAEGADREARGRISSSCQLAYRRS